MDIENVYLNRFTEKLYLCLHHIQGKLELGRDIFPILRRLQAYVKRILKYKMVINIDILTAEMIFASFYIYCILTNVLPGSRKSVLLYILLIAVLTYSQEFTSD